MNDDELAARLRRTLADRAETVHETDNAWERYQHRAPTPLASTGRGRWVGPAAGVLAAAAAIVVAVVVTSRSPSHPTHLATSAAAPPTTATPAAGAAATSAAPTTPHPAAAAAPLPEASAGSAAAPPDAGLAPESVTFVSPSEGWVLGSVPCATSGDCPVAMRHTVDGGWSWTPVDGPPGPATHVRFADPHDGWAWDMTDIWSTHDAGAAWSHVTLPSITGGALIEDVEASAGHAYAAVTGQDGTVRLAQSPVALDAWIVPPATVSPGVGGGPVPRGQIVLSGTAGWFIQVDRTVVAGARLSGGTWVPWTPPCLSAAGPAVLAASSPTELVAACDVGLWANPQGEQLYLSHDGGTTWSQASPVPAAHVSVLAAAPGVITVAGDEGGATVLAATFDEGRTPWTTVDHLPTSATVTDLGFTSGTQGVAVVSAQGQPGSLLMTHDGGHTWTTVTFP